MFAAIPLQTADPVVAVAANQQTIGLQSSLWEASPRELRRENTAKCVTP